MNITDANEVERLIDGYGLPHVLEAIAIICREKADHLRSNWQDDYAAKQWDKAGLRIDEVSANPKICAVLS